MRKLVDLIVYGFSVIIVAYILPGVEIKDFIAGFGVGILISLLNSFLRPILIFLTIPITLVTFGLFLLVINASIILIADWMIQDDYFSVKSFWWALLFSLCLSLVIGIFNKINKRFDPENEEEDSENYIEIDEDFDDYEEVE